LHYNVEAENERLGYSPKFGLNGDNTYKYINVFAYSCRHEATHGSDFVTWWGTNGTDLWTQTC
jgi:hypothetical protein